MSVTRGRRTFWAFCVAVGVIAALVVVTARPVVAAPVRPLYSGPVGIWQRDYIVEPWSTPTMTVTNPTRCLWDPDDQDIVVAQGSLAAGAAVQYNGCILADPNPVYGVSWAQHPNLGFQVTSPTAGLVVRVCYQPQGECYNFSPSPSTYGYTYALCVTGPIYASTAPEVQPVAGSNGGYGVLTTYVLSVGNSSAHTLKPIGVSVGGGNDRNACPGITGTQINGPDWVMGVQGSWTY